MGACICTVCITACLSATIVQLLCPLDIAFKSVMFAFLSVHLSASSPLEFQGDDADYVCGHLSEAVVIG